MTKKIFTTVFVLLTLTQAAVAQVNYGERADVQMFINDMVKNHQYDRALLGYWMESVEQQTGILETIAKPAESKPWKDYRPIFMTDDRIQKGIAFWKQHAELLQRAETQMACQPKSLLPLWAWKRFTANAAAIIWCWKH